MFPYINHCERWNNVLQYYQWGVDQSMGRPSELAAILHNKLLENLSCLVQLVDFNPFIDCVSLVDRTGTEHHGGDIS